MGMALRVVVLLLAQSVATGSSAFSAGPPSQSAAFHSAVPGNLLSDPRAELGGAGWRAIDDATVEVWRGSRCFTVRNRGAFIQLVAVPAGSGGSYLVVLGRGETERINQDGTITGLPTLHGEMMTADQSGILAYLTGQNLLGRPRRANEWTTMWGIFQVPAGVGWVALRLGQAERAGVNHNGSAARFTDLALVLVATKTEAELLVKQYVGR